MSSHIKLRSILQCPHCGFKVTERMPAASCTIRYDCPACGHTLVASTSGCIFCLYGSEPGPAAQRGECSTQRGQQP